jgi:serine/threonine protein kinase
MAKKPKSKVKSKAKPKDRLSIDEMKDRGLLQPGEEEEMKKIMGETKSRADLLKRQRVDKGDLTRVGQKIPGTPYTYTGLIDTGGFAVVYLAAKRTQPGTTLTDRLSAAKHLLKSATYDKRLFGRFVREGKILAKRLHPKIPYADYTHFPKEEEGDEGDKENSFILSTFIAHSEEFDPTFMTQIKGSRVAFSLMTLDDIFQTGVNTIQIEHEMHQDALATGRPKILHRDIKPGNILHRGTEAWMIDWGTATAPDVPEVEPEKTDLNITQTSMTLGTLNFLPPEVLLNGLKNKEGTVYVEPSEVYEWAATLYKTLTGRAPFEPEDEETQTQFLVKVADYFNGKGPGPRPIRELNPLVTPRVAGIIMPALSATPETRKPQTVSELYHLLRAEVGTFPKQETRTSPKGTLFLNKEAGPKTVIFSVEPPKEAGPAKKRKAKLKAAKEAAREKAGEGKTADLAAQGVEKTPADTLQKAVDAVTNGGVETTPAHTLQRTVDRALNGEGEKTGPYAGAEKTIALPSYTTVSSTLSRTYADPTRLLPYKPRKLLPAPKASDPFTKFSRKPGRQK